MPANSTIETAFGSASRVRVRVYPARMADDRDDERADRASEESFPASDPPAGPASLPPRTEDPTPLDDDGPSDYLHEHGFGREASTS
jgi:hypothetical protein